jgi:hypothetical protein
METEEAAKCEVEPQPSCRNIIGFRKGVLGAGADPAPGRGGLEPPLPPLGPWSPS